MADMQKNQTEPNQNNMVDILSNKKSKPDNSSFNKRFLIQRIIYEVHSINFVVQAFKFVVDS